MSATVEELRRINDGLVADLARRGNQVLAANADRDAAIEEIERMRNAWKKPNLPGDGSVAT